ncbi:unnamed protein product [Rhizopus stolonifer]
MFIFDAHFTQRVEGAHWSIKQILSTAGSLLKMFKSFDAYMKEEIARSLKKINMETLTTCVIKDERIGNSLTKNNSVKRCMDSLHGKVCHFVIKNIEEELYAAKKMIEEEKEEDLYPYGYIYSYKDVYYDEEDKYFGSLDEYSCPLKRNFKLPCRHYFYESNILEDIIDPNLIDSRWHLSFDFNKMRSKASEEYKPSMVEEEDSVQLKFEEAKTGIEDVYKNCENSQQRLSLLSALDKTLSESSPEIIIPKTVKTKRRPKGMAYGRLPSRFELVEKKEKKKKLKGSF